jgi:uncharacterized protein
MDSIFDQISQKEKAVAQNSFITKVYVWMSLALLVTGVTAMYVATQEEIIYYLASNKLLYFGLMAAEVGLVIWLSARVHKMSSALATGLFMAYAILNGLTLSLIFIIYTSGSIASTFFITAGTFALMSAYGYYTKADLTKLGSILIMALLGLIVASIVNIFLNSTMLYWITSYVGVLIFVGLIAYDTQKLKEMQMEGADGETFKKASIMGALTLYLDFINLFIYLLRFFGNRD